MNVPSPAVAIVTPWFGRDMKGGAEQQARELAFRIADQDIQVDVLTTCSEGFLSDWAVNQFPAGEEIWSDNLKVHRFGLLERDVVSFNALNTTLLGQDTLTPGCSPVSPDAEKIWVNENINAPELEQYLEQHAEKYSGIIFLPYLYGTTLRGLKLVDNGWLMPCLHDEVYAYLDCAQEAVLAAKGLLFLSEGEQLIAAKIYGPVVYAKGRVVGAGVEPITSKGDLPSNGLDDYVLCLGRKSEEKGTVKLENSFIEYCREHPDSPLKLVFAGPGEITSQHPSVVDCGLVSEDEKARLLAGCKALIQPSRNESFSRVIFEAWFNGRPVVVNGRCDATRIAVERANGGWPGDDENWVNEIRQLESLSLEQLNVFGESGKAYSEANVTWEAAISNTISALIEQPKPPESVHSQRILQLLPNLSFGDAISNEAIFLDQEFRSRGYESFILVRGEHIDPRVSGFCEVFEDFVVSTQDCLIYHHSIGSEITPFVEDFGGTKCMIYHNITPPQFFARSRPEFARLLRDGLEQLWNLAGTIPISFVDSDFNGADLERFGFASPITLPLPVDPGVWDCKPSRALVEKYADGLKNIVFVGRYSPNKRQVELIRVLAWLCERSPNYRLILAGFGVESDPYLQEIRAEIAEFNLDDKVVLTGHITQEELHAVYRCADLFLCLSQHEGFGVPLLEAMWFDIPVVAIRHAAVAETLQGAGIVLDGDCSLNEVASIVSKVLEDNSLRDDVIRTQRDRRVLNLPENLHNSIDELLQVLISK